MFLRYCAVTLSALLLVMLTACSRHHDEDKGKKPEGSSEVTQPKVVLEATTAQPEPGPAPATAPTPPAAPAKAPPPPPAPDPFIVQAQAKAAEIDNSLASLTKSEGRWQAGSNESTFTAYFSDANLVMIEEHLSAGDRGSSTDKYYFNNGSLSYYWEEGQWREFNSPAPVNTRKIKREMVFDENGRLTAAAKAVDSASTPIGEYEALPVQTRAQNLHNVARPPAAVAEAAVEKPATKGRVKTVVKPAEKESKEAMGSSKISFTGGSSQSTVSGKVGGKSVREHTVTAKDGQTLTLKLDSDQGAATFAVYSNRGEIVSGLKDWSAKLHRDGDYKIRVSASSGQNVAYHLSVSLQ